MNRYWEKLTLEQMSKSQWEALCDGCGRCCLIKLEDEDSGEIVDTSVACRQLDIETCRCLDYQNRLECVPMCVRISVETLDEILSRKNWLPATCAYRLLAEKKSLPEWHPLLSGNPESVHAVGASIQSFALSEEYVHPEQLVDFIISPEIS